MIAQVNIKKCPFLKKTVMTDYSYSGNGSIVDTVQEERFLECLEKSCMLYSETERKCLLGRKEEN